MRTRKVRERESRSTGGPIFACGRGRRGRGRHGLCEWCDLSCKKVVLSASSPMIVCGAKTSGSFWARKCFLNPSFRTVVAQSEKRPLKGTPRFNTTRLYLFAAVFYLVAFNYCREEALKHDFGQKKPNWRSVPKPRNCRLGWCSAGGPAAKWRSGQTTRLKTRWSRVQLPLRPN